MRASVRRDEGGVELRLDGQLCGELTMSYSPGPTPNKLLNTQYQTMSSEIGVVGRTCSAEIEESGQVAAAGQPRVGLAQLVKEGV